MDIDFERTLGASPNPYVLLDANLVIVWMNEAYLTATDRRRKDIIGRKMFDAFPSDLESESHRQLQASFDRVIESCEPDEIALIRYDIETANGGRDVRFWSATHTPLCSDGELQFILQHTVDVTELEKLRQARDEMGLLKRARSVQKENRALKSETRKLMDLFDKAPGFTAVLIGPDHRFAVTNEAYRELVGRDDLVGRRASEALPEIVDQGFVDVLDQVYQTGEAYVGRGEEVTLGPEEEGELRTCYLNFIFQPIFDGLGAVEGIIVQGYDVTDEVLSLERQNLLVNELNHRVKNTLAIVQGLASQSFRTADARSEQAVFDARLRALAEAHNLLTEKHWGEAGIDDIVRKSALAATGGAMDRLDISGDPVTLSPQTAVALAMLIHELATNAMKYGALSNDQGKVRVRWKSSGDEMEFDWLETGGPAVSPPSRKGFGTRLISRGIGDSTQCSVTMDFREGGLQVKMRAQLVSA